MLKNIDIGVKIIKAFKKHFSKSSKFNNYVNVVFDRNIYLKWRNDGNYQCERKGI